MSVSYKLLERKIYKLFPYELIMGKKIIASVIIPAYNEEKDIPPCLESLKKQSYKQLEVLLVDDGSTDNTLKIAQDTALKEKINLRVFKQNHLGPGKARNLGAINAKGNILIFVDADMTFDKDYIKNLISPILTYKKVIGTTHDYEIATNNSNLISNLWGKVRVSKEEAKYVKIFRAIRRNKFLELGGFDPKYGYADDQTFWFKYQIKPAVAKNTICYHRNPDTLKGTFKQARWIGASWKERFFIFKIPVLSHILVLIMFVLLPAMIILKSIMAQIKIKISFRNLIRYYTSKFIGYAIGSFRVVYLGKVWK